MSSFQDTLPLTADDDTILEALADAHLPSLLPALAQILCDLSLLREDLVPDTSPAMRAIGGYSDEQIVAARKVAFEALKRLRDDGASASDSLSDADVHTMLQHLTGGELTEDYVPLLLEELDYPVKDARAPKWTTGSLGRDKPFSAVVIGAGMSGILAAHRLNQAGVDTTIIEKNPETGGTWYDNTYPGARVDNQNHMYSYSFAQKSDWPYFYSTGEVLYDYFNECTDLFGIRDRIRFNTEVLAADWDEDAAAWRIRIRTQDGEEETIEAHALISSTGQLNQPKLPDIRPGEFRRAIIPLRTLGPRGRPERKARHCHRQRSQRIAAHPGSGQGSERPCHFPAHADVVRPRPELPRRRPGKPQLAFQSHTALCAVVPILDFLDIGGRAAS